MGEPVEGGRGLARAAACLAAVGLVAACANGPASSPAPVFLRGGEPGLSPSGGVVSYRSPAPVYLRGGEGGIAPGSLAAPYRATAPVLAEASSPARESEQRIVARPSETPGGNAGDYAVSERERLTATDQRRLYNSEAREQALLPDPGSRRLAAASSPHAVSPPTTAVRHTPDVIPLDRPALTPEPAAQAHAPSEGTPAAVAAATERSAAQLHASDAPHEEAGTSHPSRFPWPVSGHVVEAYGVTAGGARNDGINIAAPLGTAVRAVDGGIVAYAGNELRGYGNLVLIKHSDGWISAYAHCENLLVKRGDQVNRGQVIAKVGETGGVNQPQLHFELRRGRKAVDPREFLSPAPSAAETAAARQG